MLLVWIFTLGAGVANACLGEVAGPRTGPLPHAHHAGAHTAPMLSMAMSADGDFASGSDSDRESAAWSHRVHCQPLQISERAHPGRPQLDRQPDFDFLAAVVIQPQLVAASGVRRFAARLYPGPVSARLPLFIRFRRLIP